MTFNLAFKDKLVAAGLRESEHLLGFAFPYSTRLERCLLEFFTKVGRYPTEFALIPGGVILGPISLEEYTELFRRETEAASLWIPKIYDQGEYEAAGLTYITQVGWARLRRNFIYNDQDIGESVVKIISINDKAIRVAHPELDEYIDVKLEDLRRI